MERALPPPGYSFSGSLPLMPDERTGKWVTAADLWFELGGKASGAWVCVPKGSLTDLASIPAFARFAFNPADARMARASVVHDHLLTLPDFSPLTAALAFRDALRAGNVARWRIVVMTISVAFWTCARRGRI